MCLDLPSRCDAGARCEEHSDELEIERLQSKVSPQDAKSDVVVDRCPEHALGLRDQLVMCGLTRRFAAK